MEKTTKAIFMFVGGGITFLFGAEENTLRLLQWLIIVMSFDVITGLIKAVYYHQTSSKAWHVGIVKKIMYLLFISFCHFADQSTGTQFQDIAIGAFTLGEIISVIENFIQIGVPVSDKIRKVFSVNTTQEDTNNGK
jgi:toxin secretion/phage lysis holin